MNTENRTCQNCKKEFTIEPDDFAYYTKMQLAPPTFCPPCRLQRRLGWRNERVLYPRTCDLCKEKMVSSYTPEHTAPVYCQKCWWGDGWDAASCGRDYDFSRLFFEQFNDLMTVVPKRAVFSTLYSSLVSSEYTNLVSNLKNCYLIFNSDYDEECMYGTEIENSKNCFDNTMIDGCEQSSGSVNCRKCYQTFFSTNCESCVNVWFSKNCTGCTNLFVCANLKNKQYYIFNEQYSKEEWEKKVAEFKTGSMQAFKETLKACDEFLIKFPERSMHGRQNVNVSGEYIYNSKDVKNTYIATGAQSCKYSMWLLVAPIKDCFDYTEYGDNAELCYESLTCANGVSNIRFSGFTTNNSRDVSYSLHNTNVSNIFGCTGLRKKEYCILNKQYTKEGYEALVPKIIEHMKGTGEWSEFFPLTMSPFPYNDTNAHEFFPMTKSDVEAKGLKWREPDVRSYRISMTPENMPDSIAETPDTIVNEIIGCEHAGTCAHQCTSALRILPKELDFYRANNLPIPHLCPNCRSHNRMERRRAMSLYDRTCAKCSNTMTTSFALDRPEIVYCESCYQQEVA